MNIFIVNQNPDSKYDDVEGERYHFPNSIPNGRQISSGDLLIFNLAIKAARKLGYGDNRVIGIAKIDEIITYNDNGSEMSFATYNWYKKFRPPLAFDQIGGEYRINIQHAMNKVQEEKKLQIIASLMEYL